MCYAGEAVESGGFEGAVYKEGVVIYVSSVRSLYCGGWVG